jgi:hypothetical protein
MQHPGPALFKKINTMVKKKIKKSKDEDSYQGPPEPLRGLSKHVKKLLKTFSAFFCIVESSTITAGVSSDSTGRLT